MFSTCLYINHKVCGLFFTLQSIAHGSRQRIITCTGKIGFRIRMILLLSLVCSYIDGLPRHSLKISSSFKSTDNIDRTYHSQAATSWWTGAFSSNWYNVLNWSAGVPGSGTNVVIPWPLLTYPVITSGTASSNSITIATGASLVISSSGTLQISGSISNSGTFNVTGGTIEMNGSSSQTIPANAFYNNAIKNLVISNTSTGGVTLGGTLNLTGTLSFGNVNNCTFATGGYLTLKSNASGTASVADLTNNGTNSGNQVTGDVTVERYFTAQKKWRFLSVPTSTSQSIQSAWQEGCGANINCAPGYGTQMTGSGGTAAGFDAYSANPSLKTFDQATTGWDAVPNTSSYPLNSLSNNTVSYCIFIRGDRSVTGYTQAATSTTLRTKGVIKQGSQSAITIASPGTSFTMVGNPYPAMIDLRKMTPAPTTATKIYVWDPYLNGTYGYGGYQTLTYNGSTFTATPGSGIYGSPYSLNANYIESGEAFIVGGLSSPYTITFKENIKASGSDVPYTDYKEPNLFRLNLYSITDDTSLLDGIMIESDPAYSDSVDDNDAYKLFSGNENISIAKNNAFLGVERYGIITAEDSFHINIRNLQMQKYQFWADLTGLKTEGLYGYLWDNFLQQATLLKPGLINKINFEVTTDKKSIAADRFMIYFTPASALAVSLTSFNGYRYNDGIILKWHTEDASQIKAFMIERSNDGSLFKAADSIKVDNTNATDYTWFDQTPEPGDNYYRIKIIGSDKEVLYSPVAHVFFPTANTSIAIFPNPAGKNSVQLKMVGQPSGKYTIAIFNLEGKKILSEKIYHDQGAISEIINLHSKLNPGMYELKVINPKNKAHSLELLYQ